ncbi:AAA family ATPase [Candidatus Woesearchaeota archaeon]|nr:AAA family ATPase [Candidatus Woesearchaeota archaeon]
MAMNEYILRTLFDRTYVLRRENGKDKHIATIDYPALGDALQPVLEYFVTAARPGKPLVATINHRIEERRIDATFDNGKQSLLSYDGELLVDGIAHHEHLLPAATIRQRDKYEAGLDAIVELAAPTGTSELQFYSIARDGLGKDRAVHIRTPMEPWFLLPYALRDTLLERVKGIPVIRRESKIPDNPVATVTEDPHAGSKYVQYVRQNYPCKLQAEAFPYIEQSNEKKRFFFYMQQGLAPVLVHGPTGNGKTTLVKEYAASQRLPYFRMTGSQDTKRADFFGTYILTDANTARRAPSPLLLAVIYDGIFHLEEVAPIPQDELTGLHDLLEGGDIPITTEFGTEYLRLGPRFRFVATGNMTSRYTHNRLNDAFRQRFTMIETGYPPDAHSRKVLRMRAPKAEPKIAEAVLQLHRSFIDEAGEKADIGLKGAVRVLQFVEKGALTAGIPLSKLVQDCMITSTSLYSQELRDSLNEITSRVLSSRGYS